MNTCSLKFLGTANGYPSSHRSHSCFLYNFAGLKFLIDCGEPASRNFNLNNISWNDPGSIIISHIHFDHCGGLFMLLQSFWVKRRKDPLSVFIPQEAIEPISQLLKLACIAPEVLPFQLTLEPILHNQPIILGNAVITPILNSHLDIFRKSLAVYNYSYQSFSFLITWNKIRIAHTADIGSTKDIGKLLNNPVDLLLCELSHIQPQELFKVLSLRKVKKLALVHLDDRWENSKPFIEELAQKYLPQTEVLFPEDNDEIYFDAFDTYS